MVICMKIANLLHGNTQIDAILAWTLEYLPALNEQVYQGTRTAKEMAASIEQSILNYLPAIDSTSLELKQQLLVVLGMLGSSLERHAQQEFLKAEQVQIDRGKKDHPDPVIPGSGLDMLQVGTSKKFVSYFQQLAESIGHPARDSFASFIVFNGPGLRVKHPVNGETICTVPDVLPGGKYCTFTNQLAEVEFICLLKKSFVLQKAANIFLEDLQEPTTDLTTPDAISSALNAAILMKSIYAQMLEFMKLSSFSVDFFLDYLRQYACLWYSDFYLKPPSGANDYASIERDLILFDELFSPAGGWPGYHQYAREVFSVILPDEIDKLKTAMARQSLESKICNYLSTNMIQLEQLSLQEMQDLLTAQPWLVAYCHVYISQKNLSHLHYSSVKKYLIRPKKVRDLKCDRRESIAVVSNRYGTTGMDPLGILKSLDLARSNHPLAKLDNFKDTRSTIEQLSKLFGYSELSNYQLLELCSFCDP
jgi:hypothetical protein